MSPRAFRLDKAGWRQIANSPQMRQALKAVANDAKVYAESISEEFRKSAEDSYADSFEVDADLTVDFTETEFSGPRAAAQLKNTSDHAAAVEWGNEHSHRAHRVLGRTLDHMNES